MTEQPSVGYRLTAEVFLKSLVSHWWSCCFTGIRYNKILLDEQKLPEWLPLFPPPFLSSFSCKEDPSGGLKDRTCMFAPHPWCRMFNQQPGIALQIYYKDECGTHSSSPNCVTACPAHVAGSKTSQEAPNRSPLWQNLTPANGWWTLLAITKLLCMGIQPFRQALEILHTEAKQQYLMCLPISIPHEGICSLSCYMMVQDSWEKDETNQLFPCSMTVTRSFHTWRTNSQSLPWASQMICLRCESSLRPWIIFATLSLLCSHPPVLHVV